MTLTDVFYKFNEYRTQKMPLKLLYITRTEYNKGWHSTKHSHHFTELFYIVKGKGFFVLQDNDIPVKENDLIIINPNIEHTEKSNAQDSLEYIALGIEGLSFSLPEEGKSEIGLYTYRGDREDILFYLEKLLYEVKNSNKDYEVVCQNILEILIVKLLRDRKFKLTKTETKDINKSVALVKYYINQNFRDHLTLAGLAEIGHINKYYLAHRFKSDIGISPIEYLQQIRVQEAKMLLETTDRSIAMIGELIGFSSLSFFSQSFKRVTNQTPSSYRKEIRKKIKDTGTVLT